MPKIKDHLWKRLETMSDDIQISGDYNFRGMALALCVSNSDEDLEAKAEAERLLKRANNLIRALQKFWRSYPNLKDRSCMDDYDRMTGKLREKH